MTENQIIEKIKKLLELTSSSNEHEAARAMEHAQKLMERHCIETIPQDKPPEIENPHWTCNINHIDAHSVYPWIAISILPIFGCHSLVVLSKSGVISVFGFSTNLKIAKFALESVMNQGYAKYKTDYQSYRSLSFSSAFWKAFTDTIKEKFSRAKRNTSGLVIYDKVREEVDKHSRSTVFQSNSRSEWGSNSGRQAAKAVELRKGITPKSEGRMIT